MASVTEATTSALPFRPSNHDSAGIPRVFAYTARVTNPGGGPDREVEMHVHAWEHVYEPIAGMMRLYEEARQLVADQAKALRELEEENGRLRGQGSQPRKKGG